MRAIIRCEPCRVLNQWSWIVRARPAVDVGENTGDDRPGLNFPFRII
jgi:hypothetical protein